ncbi:MAG: hypothetical protein IJ447_09300 [Clostridia bacterium]|nr:hypothetical protein [Clostridia bacterium]
MQTKNVWKPIKIDIDLKNIALFYDELKTEEDSIKLILTMNDKTSGNNIDSCVIDFEDSVYSNRTTITNPLSHFEEIIISSHKECEPFTPLYCNKSNYITNRFSD